MSDPVVDVLIPVFNGSPFIRASITSIQKQTISDILIHVVDDGSTDGTDAILAEMAAQDHRILVYTKANGGIVDALNTGLAHCTAEFIARHDADDLAFPTRLEMQVSLMRLRPEVVATAGSARHIDLSGQFTGTYARFLPTNHADPRHIPAREPYLLHPFLMIRREALVRLGGYRHVVHAEDADLYWRLQEQGVLFNDSELQGEYRMHTESISSLSLGNGRVLAVSAQLCALSAVRRMSGQPDIDFTSEAAIEIKNASGSLEGVCAVASCQLSADEARHLRFATSIKLLETANYRPYELEMSDCLFIRKSFDESASGLGKNNFSMASRNCSGTAARLASKGLWAEGRVLLQPSMIVPFYWRLFLRKMLSPTLHRYVKWAATPIMYLSRRPQAKVSGQSQRSERTL